MLNVNKIHEMTNFIRIKIGYNISHIYTLSFIVASIANMVRKSVLN